MGIYMHYICGQVCTRLLHCLYTLHTAQARPTMPCITLLRSPLLSAASTLGAANVNFVCLSVCFVRLRYIGIISEIIPVAYNISTVSVHLLRQI